MEACGIRPSIDVGDMGHSFFSLSPSWSLRCLSQLFFLFFSYTRSPFEMLDPWTESRQTEKDTELLNRRSRLWTGVDNQQHEGGNKKKIVYLGGHKPQIGFDFRFKHTGK
mmetsp:Transcript_35754/g.93203  ORF Transcript_35754/g.93203 Transcript_35754/m.93203 type:complete len:110 (-) Transcript_35754:713-1042(-)